MDTPLNQPRSLEAFGARLRAGREARGLSLDALAAVTGISKSYLAHVETARAPGPPAPPKLRLLEKALGFDEGELVAAADWLRTPASVRALVKKTVPRRADGAIDLDAIVAGKRPRARRRRSPAPGGVAPAAPAASLSRDSHDSHDARDARGSRDPLAPLPVRPAPVINRVAAGRAAEYTDLDYPAGVADHYLPIPASPPAPPGAAAPGAAGADEAAAWKSAFACQVHGDSMTPAYAQGEWVIVAPVEPADGDDCLVRLGEADNFATTLKRVAFVRADPADPASEVTHVRLIPLNPAHAERTVAMDAVTGLFPVLYKMSPVRRR